MIYADDISYTSYTESTLVQAIDIVEQWTKDNNLIINKEKCGILDLNFKTQKTLKLEDQLKGIKIVDQYKYLGIIFSNNRKDILNKQYTKIEKTLNTLSSTLYVALKNATPPEKRRFFMIYFFSHVSYSIPISMVADQGNKFCRLARRFSKRTIGIGNSVANYLVDTILGRSLALEWNFYSG